MDDNEFGSVDLTGLEPDKLPGRSKDGLEKIKRRYCWHNRNGDFFYDAVVCGEKVQLVKDMGWLISELEACRAEIKTLKKRIDDWRGECSIESTRGMEWKERAEKAEAEVGRLKTLLAHNGIPL